VRRARGREKLGMIFRRRAQVDALDTVFYGMSRE
jgi:hypothetical protein